MNKKQTLLSYSGVIKSFFRVALCLVFFEPVQANAATWYVATTGSNSVSCGSSSSPCQTAQYVLDNKTNAGDMIRIKPGVYSSGLSFSDATRHDNVTVTADDQANRPVVGGAYIPNGVNGVTVSYLRLDGGGGRTGCWDGVVQIEEYPATIDHNEIYNGCIGVLITTSREITISNNNIHSMGIPGTERDENGVSIDNFADDPSPTSWDKGIKIIGNEIYDNSGDGTMESSQQDGNPSSHYLTLANNIIHNNEEQGSDFKGTRYVKIYGNEYYQNGFGGVSTNDEDGTAEYQHLYWWIWNNKFHDEDNFALMSQEGDDGYWYVWNNIFYANCKNSQYNWYAFSDVPANSRVENNVFWNNNRICGNGCGGINTRGSGTIIRNNIFYNNGIGSQGNIGSSSSGTISYNYVYPVSPGQTGSNAITSPNPLFVNIVSNPYNFHLQSASPPKDTGLALSGDSNYSINLDFEGFSRPQGSGWDMGAYETEGAPPVCPDGSCNGAENYQTCPQDCQAPDTQKPIVTAFSAPASASSITIPISTFTATDNIGVSGYLITESSSIPDVNDPYWSSSSLTSYQVFSEGTKTLYAWAKDSSGNISDSKNAIVSVTVPPVVQSLVAAYNFNENTGSTLTDLSGHNNIGTVSGATWNTSGKYGGSLTFNGTSSLVTVGDSDSLDLTDKVTLSAWVYPTVLSDWDTILLKEAGSNLAYGLYANNDINRPAGHLYVGNDTSISGSAQLPANQWSYLALTYDNSQAILYLNGSQAGTRTLTGSIASSTGSLSLGGNNVWGEYFQGKIDDVRVYNFALSQGAIQTDMNTPVAQAANMAPEAPGGLSVR